MFKTIVRAFPAVLFMAFLLLPLTAQVSGFPSTRPLEEFRKPAELPATTAYFGHGKIDFLGFTSQLDAWYSDQFATRPFWVRLYTQTLYTIFRESDQVHIGPRDWLFYRSVIDTETPRLEQIDGDTRKAMVARFARLTVLLEQRGIVLYVMPLTLKHRYYPEYLPRSAEHAVRFKFYDLFLDELAADGRVKLIDVRQPLLRAKEFGLKIYHRTDFHWTDAAAPIAVLPLLKDIGAREGKALADSWNYQLVVEKNISGGQARALPLFASPTEDSPTVKHISPVTVFDEKYNTVGSEWAGTAVPGQPGRFEPVLVYGDSFFDAAARSGFFNFFRAFGRARVWRQDMVEAYRNRPAETRYMVIEYISSATVGIDNYVAALIRALEQNPSL